MADRWSLVEPGTMGTWLVVTDKPFRHPVRGGVTSIVAWVNREEGAREIVRAHNRGVAEDEADEPDAVEGR